jgi:hypothetical protein
MVTEFTRRVLTKDSKLLLNKDFIGNGSARLESTGSQGALAASCLIGPKSNKRQALASDAHSKWLIIQLFIALWLVQVPLPLQKVLFSFEPKADLTAKLESSSSTSVAIKSTTFDKSLKSR